MKHLDRYEMNRMIPETLEETFTKMYCLYSVQCRLCNVKSAYAECKLGSCERSYTDAIKCEPRKRSSRFCLHCDINA